MKTKKKVLFITLLFVNFMFLTENHSYAIGITDVQVIPPNPTTMDSISIYSYGGLAYNDAPFDHSDLFIDKYSLQLDIHYGFGYLPSTGFWSHTEIVSTLPAGFYELTVNAYEREMPVGDTYVTSFEVVPEPMSILFLGFGMLGCRNRIRNKIVEN